MRIVKAEEMREIDRRAIEEMDIPGEELMGSAGLALSEVAARGATSEVPMLIVCGPGNNGGDGMAAALKLREEGFDVTVLLATERNRVGGDALLYYRRVVESDAPLFAFGEPGYEGVLERMDDFGVIIDALLGTGQKGVPDGEILRIVELVNDSAAFVVSADIPTGIECDTGLGEKYVSADYTVTLGIPKPFLFQNQGLLAASEWEIADIGFPPELTFGAGSAFILDALWVWERLPTRSPLSHKRNSGVVLVVAGADSFPGAAVLTALGALRAGAGLVIAASVPSAIDGVRGYLPECPLVRLPELDGFIGPDAVPAIAEAACRCDAVVVGPGLGRGNGVRDMLCELWKTVETRWVLDADALYWLDEIAEAPRGGAVLTPHEGEAGRLLGSSGDEVRSDRFNAARNLAEKFNQTVLLKGAYSLIASPGEDLAVNPSGNPGLATGGTGDVLAGITASLLAANLLPYDAAGVAAFWHGVTADLLAEEYGGGYGFLASEVADGLPKARTSIVSAVFPIPDEDEDDDDWENDEEHEGI